MKICPFISHMLGEDSANTLTADSVARRKKQPEQKGKSKGDDKNVVILGCDEHDQGGVQTETIPETSTRAGVPSHLFCLKEPCRFYRKQSGECIFDQMFDLLKEQAKADEKWGEIPDISEAKITKEIEKVWRLQTKSVAEMIASIGETEKHQKESLDRFKNEMSDKIESLLSRDGGGTAHQIKGDIEKLHQALQDRGDITRKVKEDVEKLHQALEAREEVVENFSTTLSELVVNIEENLSELGEKVDRASKEIEKLKGTEEDLSPWQKELDAKVNDLSAQQSQWDRDFTSLKKHQEQLMDFFENDRKRHDAADERVRQKEAKKHNNLGVTSFHNGAYEMAKDQFLRAVELDEGFAEAYNNLGLVCTELGEEENATEAFEKAIKLNPCLSAAYSNLGYVFYKQGSYEQAIEMYNEALGRSSDNSSAYTNLGNAYYKLGKLKEAREAWNRSLDLDPGNDKAKRFLNKLKAEKD
ncbi:MAG: tetratricopeptide repeat protein [Candidatus Latescibacteria bacterium]|nr:tetratricopeptide repeat protein [Candidatus Latescibacterota bacterium]NIM66445.1 tetratricopeptide repeat protein [Candidatus Latescibacterota bacterium]NIO02925.1 tetratricopeptide repeat protein [Candidatus Latescibacterota bacterium]NIO30060.1 tetratricopeptide repeat protein [Candidatus Latescibacterota bacterium]NIO57675.1 tetratricopeptide repeat protein [Candidatus Latescibacterota bacterium]